MKNGAAVIFDFIALSTITRKRVFGLAVIAFSYVLLLLPIVFDRLLIELPYYPSSGTLEDMPDMLTMHKLGVDPFYAAYVSYLVVFVVAHASLLLASSLRRTARMRTISDVFTFHAQHFYAMLSFFGLACITIQILGYWRSPELVSVFNYSVDMEGWNLFLATCFAAIYVLGFMAEALAWWVLGVSQKMLRVSWYLFLSSLFCLIIGIVVVTISKQFMLNYARLELSGYLPGLFFSIIGFFFGLYSFHVIAKSQHRFIDGVLGGHICSRCGYDVKELSSCPECGAQCL